MKILFGGYLVLLENNSQDRFEKYKMQSPLCPKIYVERWSGVTKIGGAKRSLSGLLHRSTDFGR